MFHKLRRTSYTAVYYGLGPSEASTHAGHRSDLSNIYLDTTKNPRKKAFVDVLPRPACDDRGNGNGEQPPDVPVPRKPKPSDWTFRANGVQFRGRSLQIPRGQRVVLMAILQSKGAVSLRTLGAALFRHPVNVRSKTVRVRVIWQIAALRETLRKCFDIPNDWDPVPCVEQKGTGCKWALRLPPMANS